MTSEPIITQETVNHLHPRAQSKTTTQYTTTAHHKGPKLGAVTSTITDLINNERRARSWNARGRVPLAGTGGIISQLMEHEGRQRTGKSPAAPSERIPTNDVYSSTVYKMGIKSEKQSTGIRDLKDLQEDLLKGLRLTPKEQALLATVSTMRDGDITNDSVSKAMGLSTARVQDLKKSIFIKLGLIQPSQER